MPIVNITLNVPGQHATEHLFIAPPNDLLSYRSYAIYHRATGRQVATFPGELAAGRAMAELETLAGWGFEGVKPTDKRFIQRVKKLVGQYGGELAGENSNDGT
jgi:hypothetical protein